MDYKVWLNQKIIEQQKAIKKLKLDLDETKDKLDLAETLLSNAHDLMSDTHCYNTEIYHDITLYFEDEFDLVGEGYEGIKKMHEKRGE